MSGAGSAYAAQAAGFTRNPDLRGTHLEGPGRADFWAICLHRRGPIFALGKPGGSG